MAMSNESRISLVEVLELAHRLLFGGECGLKLLIAFFQELVFRNTIVLSLLSAQLLCDGLRVRAWRLVHHHA